MVAVVEHVVAMQDVGGLARRQAGIGPIDGQVGQFEGPTAPFEPGLTLGGWYRRRRGDPQLDPSLQLDQLYLHVDGRGQFRESPLQGTQLGDVAGFGTRGARAIRRRHVVVGTIARPFVTPTGI